MTAFDGHIALVAGSGQGLGAAIALELGSELCRQWHPRQ